MKPEIGKFYSPYENCAELALMLVKEDEHFYFFEDRTKYPKHMEFSWFEIAKGVPSQDTDPFIWPYDSYSLWSRQLAEIYTKQELQSTLASLEILSERYAQQHLSAIEKTHSMQSNSQRRAQSRNNVTGNYEKKCAYKNALEIYEYYPEKCKNLSKNISQ